MKICAQNIKGQEGHVNMFSIELLRTMKEASIFKGGRETPFKWNRLSHFQDHIHWQRKKATVGVKKIKAGQQCDMMRGFAYLSQWRVSKCFGMCTLPDYKQPWLPYYRNELISASSQLSIASAFPMKQFSYDQKKKLKNTPVSHISSWTSRQAYLVRAATHCSPTTAVGAGLSTTAIKSFLNTSNFSLYKKHKRLRNA